MQTYFPKATPLRPPAPPPCRLARAAPAGGDATGEPANASGEAAGASNSPDRCPCGVDGCEGAPDDLDSDDSSGCSQDGSAASAPAPAFPGSGAGVRVHPAAGRACIFFSMRADGSEDPASLHAAEPLRLGEKWIATKW